MSSYLKALLNATESLQSYIDETVAEIKSKNFKQKPLGSSNIVMFTYGEIVQGHWKPEDINQEVSIRLDIYFSSVANAIVDKRMDDMRTLYGDIQDSWIENKEGVVEGFKSYITDFYYGDLGNLLPNVEDIDFDAPVLDMDGAYFVEVAHFLKLGEDGPLWGEFRVHAGKWVKDKETNLLHRDVIKTWPPQED